MKNIIIAVVIIALLGLGAYFLNKRYGESAQTQTAAIDQNETGAVDTSRSVVGTSVEGRDIVAYHYGKADTQLLFVGAIHGGYEWNTALVAYKMAEYLKANPSAIPANVKVTVIPVLNPDGLIKVVGTTTASFAEADVAPSEAKQIAGRFNAHTVDLNRNFDCSWQAKGVWQNKSVSGGSAAFSEPESQAVKNYVAAHKLAGAVIWYSSAGGVYASSCGNSVSSATDALAKKYAQASGYPAHASFDSYETTGDMANWLAKQNIPAISVLLTTHTGVEWDKNKAGIDAVLASFGK
ncbi:hypothetical protein KW797_00745 [Candidatus Parcubacteria bacterium]|nr:hypothetical protein [Candidatus Parcubacteria bacterium]